MSDAVQKINKSGGFRSLAVTLTVSFLVLSLSILILSSMLELLSSFRNQQIIIASQLQLIAREAASNVKHYIKEKIVLLEGTIRVGKFLNSPLDEQEANLEKLLGLEPSFSGIALFNSEKEKILTVSRQSHFAVQPTTEGTINAAFNAIKSGQSFISPVSIDEKSSEPHVTISVAITDIFGDFKGTLLAEVNLKFMWDLIDRMDIGIKGEAYVVDNNGDLIAARDISRVLKKENLLRLKNVAYFIHQIDKALEKPDKISKGFNNTYVVSDYIPLGLPNWAVVTELPVDEAFEPVINKIKITVGIILISLLLAAFIGIYFSRKLSRPIIELRNAAAKIGKGMLDTRVEIREANEIGELAHSINRMTGDLQRTTTSIDNLNREMEERKKAENELRQSEASLKSIYMAAPVGISVAKNRIMLTVNRHLCEIIGYPEEELIGQNARLFFEDNKEYERVGMELYGNIEQKEYTIVETKMMTKNGKRINVLLTAATIENTDRTIITMTDITFLTEIQEQLRKKSIEVFEFTNTVTHDLRKPLTAIKIILDLAHKGALGKCNNDGVEAMNTGLEAANYMQEMLDDLAACARLDVGTQELAIETTGFKELADSVVARLKYQIDEKGIIIETPGDDVTVNADRKQLTRVLMNLVGNAVAYIGSGSGKRIRIGFERRNGIPLFFIEDNGMGIPPESRQHLFTKFKRGGNVSGIPGTGLGLAIVKGIVEAHCGKIWFDSEEGKGTTFYFTLGNNC